MECKMRLRTTCFWTVLVSSRNEGIFEHVEKGLTIHQDNLIEKISKFAEFMDQ